MIMMKTIKHQRFDINLFNNFQNHCYRKNHQRAMDSVQVSLEAEVRAKQEAFRLKKKLESDINELEIALDHANKANSEAHKSVKRYQGQLRETEQAFENENRQRSV
jgi:myosin heavy chain 6/7